jgi:hypothetical protein
MARRCPCSDGSSKKDCATFRTFGSNLRNASIPLVKPEYQYWSLTIFGVSNSDYLLECSDFYAAGVTTLGALVPTTTYAGSAERQL